MASATSIARKNVEQALAEAAEAGLAKDSVARAFLALSIEVFLSERAVEDVRQEVLSAAEYLDPDEEFAFMRP